MTATIWKGIQVAFAPGAVTSGDAAVATATTKTRRFGKKLHIALVTIKIPAPALPLQPGTIYSYDIVVNGKGLKQLGLLSDEDPLTIPAEVRPHRPLGLALGYVADRLPSFVTPPATIEQTRLAHCSCRNTEAPGYDALAWLDDIIENRLTDPAERPQQLFMTGDQIYADDLSSALLFMLSALAHEIVGANEQLHVVASNSQVGNNRTPPEAIAIDQKFAANLTNFPAHRRHKVVLQLGGYTTGDGNNHLLSFGEYAAMYLAVWSPRVWSALGKADELFVAPAQSASQLLPFFDEPEKNKKFGGDVVKWRDAAKATDSGFNKQIARIELFRVGVPHVARVLANVATYMIFDDHDVTDDWNLHKKWLNRVHSKPFGRQIVRNAVMAYGLFQGWGNDPVAFETGKNKELLDEVEKLHAGDGPYPVGSTDRIDTLSGTSGAAHTEQAVWNYVVPAPRMQVVVLDTRTRRKFTGQNYFPPDLIGLNRDAQLPAGPMTDGREVIFIVSAAPVLGADVIDSLGWPAAQIAIDTVHLGKGVDGAGTQKANIGVEKYDAEGWSTNELAREQFLQRLATHPRAVILSGDVHFASTVVMDYYRKGVAVPSRIVQLTSSPARNTFKPVVKLLARQNPYLQRVETEFNIARLAWTGASSVVVPTGVFVSPGRRSRMKRSPSLLPAGGWPDGTSFPDDKQPDWRWRIRLVRDVRAESAMPSALRQPLFLPSDELNESNALPAYRSIAARHQVITTTRFEFLRQMIFQSNIGLVRLRKAGSDIILSHTLISEDAPDSVTGAENTLHEVTLAASTEPPPGIEFR